MASKIFFSRQKVYFWISAFDRRAIVLDKMHIVHCIFLRPTSIEISTEFKHVPLSLSQKLCSLEA